MSTRKSTLKYGVNSKNIFLKVLSNIDKHKFMYILILPGFLWFIIFNYYPLYFLQAAFRDYNVFTPLAKSEWVGFQNFIEIFNTRYFNQAFRNTIIISIMYNVFAFPIPIIFAIMLNELRSKYFMRSIQTVLYLPHFLSWVIVAGIWIVILSPDGGLVNQFLGMFGIEPVFFMINRGAFRWILLVTHVWKEAGWSTIIYMAAISGISQELYEAAYTDGANRFKQMINITLPSLLPTIIVVFILGLGKILNVFEQVFVMYNPVVAEVSETIDTYVYQIGLVRGELSFGMAVGLFKNCISLVLLLMVNYIAKKYQEVSIL